MASALPTDLSAGLLGCCRARPNVRVGSWRCENVKTLNRDRRSYSFKTVLVAQRASEFNLEIELKNIILRRVSIFEFLHSQGHKRSWTGCLWQVGYGPIGEMGSTDENLPPTEAALLHLPCTYVDRIERLQVLICHLQGPTLTRPELTTDVLEELACKIVASSQAEASSGNSWPSRSGCPKAP